MLGRELDLYARGAGRRLLVSKRCEVAIRLRRDGSWFDQIMITCVHAVTPDQEYSRECSRTEYLGGLLP